MHCVGVCQRTLRLLKAVVVGRVEQKETAGETHCVAIRAHVLHAHTGDQHIFPIRW